MKTQHLPTRALAVLGMMAVSGLAASGLAASGLAAQDSKRDSISVPAGPLPLVFLDCQSKGCDRDFLRTELTWMNFVRDRNQSQVHILATSQNTGAGGSEITVTFDQQTPVVLSDSLRAIIPQGATDDEERRILARTIGRGMLPFIRGTPLADQLSVLYTPSAGESSGTRGASDPWHLWVYRISAGGYTNGDENYTSLSTNASVRASRTTEDWKFNFSLDGDYRENSYTLSETKTLQTYQHNWGGNSGAVKSLTPRWSAGASASVSSSVQSNQDVLLRAGPALEFNVFPYAESTRRQIIFQYSPGVRYANYTDSTIFGKLKETHPDHQFLLAAELTQSWGSVSASTSFNQLLDDLSKSNLNVNGNLSWRIVTGLNLNVGGSYSRIRNQLNLKRGKQGQEDVLLQLRQLRTGYSYRANIGLSFTFGSIFQNVVNPRLSEGSFF